MDISCARCVWMRESICSLLLRNCSTDKVSLQIVVLVLIGVILIAILVLVLIY